MSEEFDPVAYLAGKGKHGKPVAGGKEISYACFLGCGRPDDDRKKKLYVEAESGFYQCKVCGDSGGSYLLQKHFGDEPSRPEPGSDPSVKRRILNWAAELGQRMLMANDDMLLYLLNERGLSIETIEERKLGWVGKRWSLVGNLPEQFSREELNASGLVFRDGPRAGQDFFYDHLLIPYLHRGNVVQIRGKVHGAKYFTGPGEPVRVYNLDDLDGADDVIITEGEYDAMALKQHLATANDDRARKTAVIGLAGANGFKAEHLPYLADAKRVFIGLDPDDTGKREAVKLKELLGTRARILELPEALPKADWTDYLLPVPPGVDDSWRSRHPHAGHDWRDVMSLLGTAAGKRVFTMSEAGHSWRSQRDDGVSLQTGYIGLDETITGMKPGQVMIVLAKTGTGKTLLLCNLAYNMRAHNILFISLEMTREECYDRLRRIFLFHNPAASDYELEQAMSSILICDENRLGEGDLTALVDEYEIETGGRPDVVFVDYLGYYARGARGNTPYEKTTNAVMQLKAEAKAGRYVVISPAQVNRGTQEGKPIDLDDARDAGTIEETADFLLSIWRPDDALQEQMANAPQSGKIKMTILKSRHGGKDKQFTLVMDLLTLALVDDKTREAKRASEHNMLAWRGTKWDDLRRAETRPRQQTFDTRDVS